MAHGLAIVWQWITHRIAMPVDGKESRSEHSISMAVDGEESRIADKISMAVEGKESVRVPLNTMSNEKSSSAVERDTSPGIGDLHSPSAIREETPGKEDDQQFGLRSIAGSERSLVVDSVTLLGGNEYLVQQMIDRLLDQPYTNQEQSAIQWATKNLWGEDLSSAPINLQPLLDHLTPLHLDRLPRILASSLLFCGRYPDTQVVASLAHPTSQMITINLHNLPGAGPPIGHTPSGTPCSRLSILYHWASPQPVPPPQPKGRTPARKISASLALEKKILSLVNVFAIIPCP